MPYSENDFFKNIPAYAKQPEAVGRLQARWCMIIAPILEDIAGAHVLDLAAHDGRWAYAFAQAGADRVTAVEARPELVAAFDGFPSDDARSRVDLRCVEVFDFLQDAIAAQDTYDIVAVLGFLYHTMDHYRLFVLLRQLSPKIILVDSEFMTSDNAIVQITAERTDKPLNAFPLFESQQKTLVGVPSVGAMARIADVIGYDIIWPDLDDPSINDRHFVPDYFRPGRKRRRTCFLVRRF